MKILREDLNAEEIDETFYEKELQKTNQTEFRIEKVIKRKVDKLYVKWNAMVILVIVGSIKKILLYKTSYFPEPYTRSKNKIKAELYLSN